LTATTSPAGTWYRFGSPSYNAIDELLAHTITVPGTGGGPPNGQTGGNSYTYASDGTRRVTDASLRTGTTQESSNSYSFDVFGNKLTEYHTAVSVPGCSGNGSDNSTYGADNAVLRVFNTCQHANRYWNDKSGNRLVQLDSNPPNYLGPSSIMSYTAKNQLFFSMTPTGNVGTYDYNWHWYDAAGRRMLSQRQLGPSWVPGTISPTGNRTFYVYDGSDVALTVVKSGGSTWWVKARYLTGGIDDNLGGRFRDDAGGAAHSLALANDNQGSTLAAMTAGGLQETSVQYFSRDPYGGLVGATGTGGGANTETGFAGASTPNASGGFVYLRNRWYDPKSGRFLTQDPIGLAGGVNLYAYAGNNPISFDDPFGLCPRFPGTIVPCELIAAVYSEASNSRRQQSGIAHAIINRATDPHEHAHPYGGYRNTGNRQTDVAAQASTRDIQGTGNNQYHSANAYIAGTGHLDAASQAKINSVAAQADAAYRGTSQDETHGGTFWRHGTGHAPQGNCHPRATTNVDGAQFYSCSQ